ncbi:MAG: 16S rRNA (cytosine(1402)-N(4))-methyltransferase RsmH [Candidatus Omnitrophota bacterium]
MHQSVLLKEVLAGLAPAPGKTIVDGTLGTAGHAQAILRKLGPSGRLIGFDKDPKALEGAKKVLEEFGDRVMIFHDDFKNIAARLREREVSAVEGILLDLGVSSAQLDEAERGFSFRKDGPLDMRMNPEDTLTAEEIVNTYPEEKLAEILKSYGEERYARRIATKIAYTRKREKIRTTGQLSSLVFSAVPSSYRYGWLHPATRTFQAFRIAVNKELEALRNFLEEAPDLLADGGRLVIISFHSLEDRIVKTAFRELAKKGLGRILTKKPVVPEEEETRANPRARSAKMRIFEKAKEQNG